MTKKSVFVALMCLSCHTMHAQWSRLADDLHMDAGAEGSFSSGDNAPFWFTSNRYGLGTDRTSSGYLRAGLSRDVKADSLRNWRIGYGADLVVPFRMQSNFVVQQLYADLQWKALRLGIGQKERPLELKNQLLSTGSLTSGINARPLPQVRLELPGFLAIPGTRNWLSVKGHIAYGCFTDNAWQRAFNGGNSRYVYSANSLYHSKAGFLRIGNAEELPLTLTGGFEMSCQFGGEAWNLVDRLDHTGAFASHQKMDSGLKGFWNAFIPGGYDANDGDYQNCAGNQLGSWHARLDYHGRGWGIGLYGEHFFEDESQMFWQYGWKDGLVGIEAILPRNPIAGTFVIEYLHTSDQSGCIYHDATDVLPIQLSAVDEYYNHHVYGAWQHAGFVMGNPLLVSPIYDLGNNDGHNRIMVYNNRVSALHFGLSGQPLKELGYRILFTHERSLGTYNRPATDPYHGNYLMVELNYTPHWIEGFTLGAAYGQNGGDLLGSANGGMLSLKYHL